MAKYTYRLLLIDSHTFANDGEDHLRKSVVLDRYVNDGWEVVQFLSASAVWIRAMKPKET